MAGAASVFFQLLSANYGAQGKTIDVTANLSTVLDSNGDILNKIDNFNSFFGKDPVPGVVKTLSITYSKNGAGYTISIRENADIYMLPYDFKLGSSIPRNTTINQDMGLRSEDGSHILVQQRDGNLVIYNMSSGKQDIEWATGERRMIVPSSNSLFMLLGIMQVLIKLEEHRYLAPESIHHNFTQSIRQMAILLYIIILTFRYGLRTQLDKLPRSSL